MFSHSTLLRPYITIKQSLLLLIVVTLSLPLASEERAATGLPGPVSSPATNLPRPSPIPAQAINTKENERTVEGNQRTTSNNAENRRLTESTKPTATPIRKEGSLLNSSLPINYGIVIPQKQPKPLHQLVITASDIPEAERQRKALSEQAYQIVSRKSLIHLGLFLSTFQVPEAISLNDAQAQVKSLFPDSSIEANKRFHLLGMDIKRYGQSMMHLTASTTCQDKVTIAMLDSRVNPKVIHNKAEDIQIIDVTGKQRTPDKHGTAVANLLISNDEHYPGVLPNARLYAINVFSQGDGEAQETRLDWLIYGFNEVAGIEPKPAVVNLSFGGEYSSLLEKIVTTISTTIPLVAAAGNAGSDKAVYPAAFDSVIAVGSLDARSKRSKDSNYGPHVKLFAPGEDIWTINQQGKGFFARGTSYASPFAAAAIALANTKKNNVNAYIQSLTPSNTITFSPLCF